MNRITLFAACVLPLITTAPIRGQTADSQPVRAETPATHEPVVDELAIPNAIPLNDLFPMLQKKVGSFQYVAKPGDWQTFELPPMHLRNVSIPQVFQLLGELDPDLDVSMVGPASRSGETIYVLKDRPHGEDLSPGNPRYVRVMAFGLADVITYLASLKMPADNPLKIGDGPQPADNPDKRAQQWKEARDAALEDVLSLLQAAIAQSGTSPGQPEPVLKLHPGTQVLLVKGTNRQLEAITEAINALSKPLGQKH